MTIKEKIQQEARLIRAKKSKLEITIKLILPILIALLVIFGLWLTGTDIYLKFIYLVGVYIFTPIGMIAGLPFGMKIGLSIWHAVVFMIFMDAMTSLWIIWNIDLIKVVPGLGYLVRKSQESGKTYLKRNPKIRKFAFLGLTFFVLIPIYGSGSILGSIIGKIISMREHIILLSVLTGVTIRLIIMGLVAEGLLYFI